MDTINIILADNQSLTRVGTLSVLALHYNQKVVAEEAKNKNELLEKLKTGTFHALIVDFDLFDFKEISELAEIKASFPGIGILIVTDNQNHEDVRKVLDCGITNYVLKSCSTQELIDAFQATISSKKYFSSEILDLLIQQKTTPREFAETGKLTHSEIEIVRLIAQGLTTKEIAQQKILSFHTIITHRKNIFRKLGISNTSELLMYAMRTGIIDSAEYYI